MGKKREKLKRSLIALLALMCILSNMPITAFADDNVSNIESEAITDQTDIKESDTVTEEQVQTDTDETETDVSNTDESDNNDGSDALETDQTGNTEDEETAMPEDTDTDDSEPKEETEDNEDSEVKAPETGQSNEVETEETEQADKSETEEAEQADRSESEETEKSDITDGAGSEEESSIESTMLLSEEMADTETDTEAKETADDTYTDDNGVEYHYYGYEDGTANIYEVESYEVSNRVGKDLNIPSKIGDYKVTKLTFQISRTTNFPSVTIPETITYLSKNLFIFATIENLYYNAVSATTGVETISYGVFDCTVNKFNFGENVKTIPDLIFNTTYINVDELILDVEYIGEFSFNDKSTITDLTIGENVKVFGANAFRECNITNFNFNAINAALQNNVSGGGPFHRSIISNISFGDNVEVIPERLLDEVTYSVESLTLPDSVREIGEQSISSYTIHIGELTIGENVSSFGKLVFYRSSIDILNYNCVDAEIFDTKVYFHNANPFYATHVGELRIGENVKSIPDNMFFGTLLTQYELILPENLEYIGTYALSSDNISEVPTMVINNITIYENVSIIGNGAFGQVPVKNMTVYAAGTEPMDSSNTLYRPDCDKVTIHRGSYFYDHFTENTKENNITVLCKLETSYDEPYFDEEISSFVTVITDACAFCGYSIVNKEYEKGCTVRFIDYDGKELSRQHLYIGEDAATPDNPERKGYQFTGWDKSLNNVTADLTVKAQYKILTFHVVFKDGEKIISDQEVDYGQNAIPPKAPARPDEEWGRWIFTMWDGNYTDVEKDEEVYAQYEKAINEYEVIFCDDEGNILSRQTVAHGMPATAPPNPAKEADDEYTYTFIGWDKDFSYVKGNMTINAVFDKAEIDDSKDPDDEDDSKDPDDEDDSKDPDDEDDSKDPDDEDDSKDPDDEDDSKDPDDEDDSKNPDDEDNTKEPENNPKKRKPTPKTKNNDNEPENTDDDGDIDTVDDPDIENPESGEEITPEAETKVTEWKFNLALPQQTVQKLLPYDTVSLTEEKYIETPIETAEVNISEEDKEEKDNEQDTAIKEDTVNKKDNSGLKWISAILGITAATAFGIWLYLTCFKSKKIYGTVLNEDGGFMCGAQLVLTGKGILETKTDEKGYFCFDNLKKGDYRLKAYHEEGWIMYSADILMDSENKDVTFSVLESNCESVETKEEKGKYEINIKA